MTPQIATSSKNRADPVIYVNRAYCYYYMTGDCDRALSDYNKAISLGDNSAKTISSRLALLLRMKKYAHIYDYTTEILQERISDARLLVDRALASIGMTNIVAASNDLERAAVVCLDSAVDCNEVAWTYVSRRDVRNGQRALQLAKRAVELSRQHGFLHTLACAYAETGDFTSAICCINEAISISNMPDYTSMAFALSNRTKYIEMQENEKQRGAGGVRY